MAMYSIREVIRQSSFKLSLVSLQATTRVGNPTRFNQQIMYIQECHSRKIEKCHGTEITAEGRGAYTGDKSVLRHAHAGFQKPSAFGADSKFPLSGTEKTDHI